MEGLIKLLSQFHIIDDDPSFCKSLTAGLIDKGFSADYFSSAQTFFDSVPPGQKGYSIVDFHMPDCDGFYLIEKMKQLNYGMTIIMTSGHPHDDTKDKAIEKGAIGFLEKPFSVESLIALCKTKK